MDLKNKVALVTGGAHRVGKAITLQLARAGAHVVVNYNTSDQAAQQTVAEVTALGVKALAIQCDVADLAAVRQMATVILEQFGGVDVIINSASHFEQTPFPSADPAVLETWRKVTRILIDGPYYICNTLVPTMQARGGGIIINIVDLSAWHPWINYTAHVVGKSSLLALTRQLALELAPTIRVNAVAPGLVLPPSGYDEARKEQSTTKTLLNRWGEPKDVALAVKYLIEADFVTGEVLTLDGGERYAANKRR